MNERPEPEDQDPQSGEEQESEEGSVATENSYGILTEDEAHEAEAYCG